MIPTDGWRSVSEGKAPMPSIPEDLRNPAADAYYTNAGASSAGENAPATSSDAQATAPVDNFEADYDEDNPDLPGSPVVDVGESAIPANAPARAAGSADSDAMLNEIAAQYDAY